MCNQFHKVLYIFVHSALELTQVWDDAALAIGAKIMLVSVDRAETAQNDIIMQPDLTRGNVWTQAFWLPLLHWKTTKFIIAGLGAFFGDLTFGPHLMYVRLGPPLMRMMKTSRSLGSIHHCASHTEQFELTKMGLKKSHHEFAIFLYVQFIYAAFMYLVCVASKHTLSILLPNA